MLTFLQTRWTKFAKQHCDELQTHSSSMQKGLKLRTQLQETERI